MSVRRLKQRPALGRLYLRAAITARGRHGNRLPDISLQLPDVPIDRAQLARYAEVCGFRQSDVLPPTYPHVLAFPLATNLMVDPTFPFPLPGLVHLRNRIIQRRALGADERLMLSLRASDLREHGRGRQFDMLTEATVGGEVVWEEVGTYLRRERRSPGSTPPGVTTEHPAPTAIWRVPRDSGRRYAAVSGDVNPIHLNPLAARLFGFRRAIAHGMWLKARCLAALEGRLPDALTSEVEFKSPLLLPSTVAFSAQPGPSGWAFSVFNARSGRPHLTGSAGS